MKVEPVLMPNVGFRVYKKVKRPSPDLVRDFGALPTATIGDVLNRMGCMSSRLKGLNDLPLAGPAITVRARPGDNLMFHHAIDIAQPGDVLVVDGGGDSINALAGENMVLWAIRLGLAGFVVDGAMRDVHAIKQLGFPVFCTSTQPNGPFKMGPGEVNAPITCGGVTVCPGDIIVGDTDGVAVIRREDSISVLALAQKKKAQEDRTKAEIEEGTWNRVLYSEDALGKLGCEFIDDYCVVAE